MKSKARGRRQNRSCAANGSVDPAHSYIPDTLREPYLRGCRTMTYIIMDFENSVIEQARTEHEILLEDPKSVKQKKRNDRKRRRKIKFSDKHHSREGIISTVIAAVSIALVAASVAISVSHKGEGGWLAGYMPFVALVISTLGIVLAAITFRKEDTIYTFSWIGMIANIVVWLFVAFLLAIGL